MKWSSFTEARKYVRSLKLKSRKEWEKLAGAGKLPDDIPRTPNSVYKKEWKGVGDWLGTGNVTPRQRKFRSYEDARKFARKLKLKGKFEWAEYVKQKKHSSDIPNDPRASYKNKGWVGWGDFLGTGNIAPQDAHERLRSFEDARKYVRSLKLASQTYWKKYCTSGKKPDDIPAVPERSYKKEWTSYGDWLGTNSLSSAQKAANWLSANEARIEIARIAKDVFGGKPFTARDWYRAHDAGKIPKNIPKRLEDVYDPSSRRNRRMKKK